MSHVFETIWIIKLLKYRSHSKELNCLAPSVPLYFRSSQNTIKRLYFEVKFTKWLSPGGVSPFTLVLYWHSIFSVLEKSKTAGIENTKFSRIVHLIVTSKVPVTILPAYIFLRWTYAVSVFLSVFVRFFYVFASSSKSMRFFIRIFISPYLH